MAPPSPLRRCALLAPVLVAACIPPDAPAPRRADATAATDRPAVPMDATAPVDATAAPMDVVMALPDAGPRSPLDLFVVGGGAMLRLGSSAALRVERFGAGSTRVDDVTRAARFRVEPATAGSVDPNGTFHGLAPGRARITAVVGAEEVSMIFEVSSEVPAGMAMIPTLQVSDGRVAHSVIVDLQPDGTVVLDVQAARLTLAMRGHLGPGVRSFPIAVPMEDTTRPPPRDGGVVAPATGTLVFDRWTPGRLDGHATLRVAGRPLGLRFSVPMGNPMMLLQRAGS